MARTESEVTKKLKRTILPLVSMGKSWEDIYTILHGQGKLTTASGRVLETPKDVQRYTTYLVGHEKWYRAYMQKKGTLIQHAPKVQAASPKANAATTVYNHLARIMAASGSFDDKVLRAAEMISEHFTPRIESASVGTWKNVPMLLIKETRAGKTEVITHRLSKRTCYFAVKYFDKVRAFAESRGSQ